MLVDVKCQSCAADLTYEPGTTSLICGHCSYEMEIEQPLQATNAHVEFDLEDYLDNYESCQEQIEALTVTCDSCGASTEFGTDVKATHCAFCDTPLVLSRAENKKRIKPQGILPFKVNREKAVGNFGSWVKGLWLAPNDLKNHAKNYERFQGIYLPYWTYDCDVATDYRGERGTNYQVTKSVTNSEGKTEFKTETKTRWKKVSGSVETTFDDVLVPATKSLKSKQLHKLEPWDLSRMVDYSDSYLQGYQAETYQIDIKQGYSDAKDRMQFKINEVIREDIGGDKQSISATESVYTNATFKHLILPVWVTSYRYKEKVYQVLVNAQTGEVQGDRPYCPIKVGLLTAFGVLVGVAIGILKHKLENS